MFKRLSNQGGAILPFIIIAAILAAVTLGAIYFVQQRGVQARHDQAVVAANKFTAVQQAAQKAADDAQKAAQASKTPSQSSTTNATTTSPTTTATTTPTNAGELPTTGPADTFVTMLAIGCLTLAVASFISSRRALVRSL